jgi:flagellar biosynthetic protein FlhB
MSDSDQEKSEDPTQRRRDDAAKDGKVPRSQELTAAALLLASATAINMTGPGLARALRDIMGSGLGFAAIIGADMPGIVELLRGLGLKTLGALGAFLAAMAGASLVIGALQARGVVSMKPVMPDFNRMNPGQNYKRVVGTQSLVELIKSLFKLAIVGWAVWHVIGPAWPDIAALSEQPPRALLEVIQRYSVGMLRTAGLAYIGLAGADYAYQLYQHEQGLRMTKEEVKQESKSTDGDPMVKQRQRSIGRQRARSQMFKDVPKADVVLVNPIHIAVALKYDPDIAAAPYVIALGRRKVAERIKALAYESGVPVVENIPLARALIASVKLNMMIPTELYLAVAEVLAFVMNKRDASASRAA